MKLFQKEFGKTVVKLPVKSKRNCKGNIMENIVWPLQKKKKKKKKRKNFLNIKHFSPSVKKLVPYFDPLTNLTKR